MLALPQATSAHVAAAVQLSPLLFAPRFAVSTATRSSGIRACDGTDPEEEQPVASYALASAPAAVSLLCGEPLFAALLLPLIALGRTVQAPPAAAVLVAIVLYDAGATLLGDRSGALVALTACSVGAAALSLGIADEGWQALAGAMSRDPPPLPSTEPKPRRAKELSPEQAEFLEAKRAALRLRQSWDARLQWRGRKRRQAGAGKDSDGDGGSEQRGSDEE
jgi:hypothetical protein